MHYTIYDNVGKTYLDKSVFLKEGSHLIEVSANQLNGPGIYYIKLESATLNDIKTMFLIGE